MKKKAVMALFVGTLFFTLFIAVPIHAEVERLSLGAGPGFAPDYEGSDDYTGIPMLFGEAMCSSRRYVRLSGPKLRVNILAHDRLRLGPLANFRIGRDDTISIDDSKVKKMEEVDDSFELGGFAGLEIERWNLMVDALSDVSDGHDGFVLEISTGYAFPVSDSLRLSIGASGSYADDDYMSSFFDVSPADSGASGLPVYSADSGFKDVGCNIGAVYKCTDKWSVRASGGYKRLLDDAQDSPVVDDRGDENQLNLGIMAVYTFGAKKAKEDAPPTPTDSDGDGVYDEHDKCPDTPRGVKVDSNGCPLDSDGDGVADYLDKCPDTPKGVKVDATGCPLDSDGDGVPDFLDTCPNTPKGVKVDSSGCPIDSDGDGVPDYRDECPDTPKGATVDSKGCWALTGVVLFDFDSAAIKPEAYPLLDEVVKILEENPEIKGEIQGHTDSLGPEPYNQQLSERRAKAVEDYIESKGIDRARLSSKGYGEAKPVASNDTDEGRQENRRVRLQRIN